MNGQSNANERTTPEQAAMEVWLLGSADTTGMQIAVRTALAMQREQIAQAIEARIIDLPGLSGDDETQRSWARGESLRFAARIARHYGEE